MSGPVIDLFAGPGGWSEGLRMLGHAEVGIELDEAACATARAAGHARVQADVAALDPRRFFWGLHTRYMQDAIPPLAGLIGSPPCPTFSSAGKGGGRHLTDVIIRCAEQLADGHDARQQARDDAYAVLQPIYWKAERAAARKKGREPDRDASDARARKDADMSVLVLEPLRWTLALRPDWVALEQVPPVLELWKVIARLLELHGWNAWAGVLEAERYGVPQTRERAVLMAHRDRAVHPPRATHQRYVPGEPARHDITLEGEVLPWVSMAQALGWQEGERVGFPRNADNGNATDDGYRVRDFRDSAEPAFNLTEKARSMTRMRANAQANASERAIDEPAPTIKGGNDSGDRVWLDRRQGGAPPRSEEPAHTMSSQELAKGRDVWLRAGTNAHDIARPADEPAPTIRFGARANAVDWVHERPAPTVVGTRRSKDGMIVGRQLPDGEGENVGGRNWLQAEDWPAERPSTTVAGDSRIFQPGGHHDVGQQSKNAVRVTVQEAAVLQSFRSDYPWSGSRTKQFQQVGNAVPPLLARAILAELV